jgi:putative ABC transport system substrate-binding protein
VTELAPSHCWNISMIAGATVWPFAARAQQRAMPVIGFFTYQPASGATTKPMLAAFRRGLTEAGYTRARTSASNSAMPI